MHPLPMTIDIDQSTHRAISPMRSPGALIIERNIKAPPLISLKLRHPTGSDGPASTNKPTSFDAP
jgi:hypothetical protein